MRPTAKPTLAPGVSVVVPTYLGAERIGECLASLAAQTLAPSLFDVVIVSNGPSDGTEGEIARFCEEHPAVSVTTVRVHGAGASMARNLGLSAAAREYVTFIDDDDHVSPQYLAALLDHGSLDTIVVGQVADVTGVSSAPSFDSYITRALAPYAGTTQPITRLPTALAFNAAKLVSTVAARAVGYDTSLRSGEDVVFWLQVALRNRLQLRVLESVDQAVYYRHVRSDSVSRQSLSVDFSIEQRLDVLVALDRTRWTTSRERGLVESLMRSQTEHMRQYLLAHPDEVATVLAAVEARDLEYFDRGALMRGLAEDLVIAYAFPPWNDTSAGVMARRVHAAGRLVDVLCVDLDALRDRDTSTDRIIDGTVARSMVVEPKGRPGFGSWRAISEFSTLGMERVSVAELESGPYRSVYSRSMWPASHIAAAVYKSRHPRTPWTAEFSDPMLVDSNGKRRHSIIGDDAVSRRLRRALRRAGVERETDNVWEWAELLPYAMADTVVFTNENQRAYMLEYCTEPALVDVVMAKSVVAPHPTLPEAFYRMSEATLDAPSGVVTIGYFGVFYASRGLTEVVDAIGRLRADERAHLRLYAFTSMPDELAEEARALGLDDVIVARPYLPYLDFLAVTTQLDCLLVNDARTQGNHAMNPYLPSKLSDYAGSGTDIWSIVEPGSILSGIATDYRSEVGDVDGAERALRQIMADNLPRPTLS